MLQISLVSAVVGSKCLRATWRLLPYLFLISGKMQNAKKNMERGKPSPGMVSWSHGPLFNAVRLILSLKKTKKNLLHCYLLRANNRTFQKSLNVFQIMTPVNYYRSVYLVLRGHLSKSNTLTKIGSTCFLWCPSKKCLCVFWDWIV